MAVVEFFEEDMSPSGLEKIRGAIADAYPEDAEILIRSEMEWVWPRPLLIVEGAAFGGLEIVMDYSGDTVSREARDVGDAPVTTDG